MARGSYPGEIIVGLSMLGSSQGRSGDGVLATISFAATGPGNVIFAFTRASVRGPDARKLEATFTPGHLSVSE